MTYENFIKDFADRTMENLKIIEDISLKKENESGFEITQLINSMIGLLIFPQQKYFNQLKKFDSNDEIIEIFKNAKEENGENKNFAIMLRHMRNSISHNNLKIHPNALQKSITEIEFWDKKSNKETARFTLKISDIKKILIKIHNLVEDIEKNKIS